MSSKRKVTQSDLRKAMNDAKKKVGNVKKVESPLAKYTESGQLMCILCKSIVKSEPLWLVHLNSKAHKENIEAAKRSVVIVKDNEKETSQDFPTKRPISVLESNSNKKIKRISEGTGPIIRTEPNLPVDFFDSSLKQPTTLVRASRVSEASEIPRVEKTHQGGGSTEAQEPKDDGSLAALPEGFFDDPKMDAKVRNIDYKDPIEEEWEKFQREIKEEAVQSAQIIADDQEEATTVRQLDEIEEQMRNWNRVMDFVKLKEQVQTSEKKIDSIGEDESSDDDEDYDEFLDWRAKNSY